MLNIRPSLFETNSSSNDRYDEPSSNYYIQCVEDNLIITIKVKDCLDDFLKENNITKVEYEKLMNLKTDEEDLCEYLIQIGKIKNKEEYKKLEENFDKWYELSHEQREMRDKKERMIDVFEWYKNKHNPHCDQLYEFLEKFDWKLLLDYSNAEECDSSELAELSGELIEEDGYYIASYIVPISFWVECDDYVKINGRDLRKIVEIEIRKIYDNPNIDILKVR